MEGSQILNLGHVTLTTPTFGGQFVLHWLGHVMVSVSTKNEVTIFGHSKDQCKKTCQFKIWCKGDKSNIENSTDHFCENTRQNALAALTNLQMTIPH